MNVRISNMVKANNAVKGQIKTLADQKNKSSVNLVNHYKAVNDKLTKNLNTLKSQRNKAAHQVKIRLNNLKKTRKDNKTTLNKLKYRLNKTVKNIKIT